MGNQVRNATVADIKPRDEITGVETTGHEWDGIRELNNPLPRWWLYIIYASIVWSIGYWIAMPAWPTLQGYTAGMLGYSERAKVAEEIEAAQAAQAGLRGQISSADLPEVLGDPALLSFALAGGRAAFGDNCAPCHGSGAAGSKGYPNLNDDDWIWGGSLENIHDTIAYGIRSEHDDTRINDMPAFLRDGILERDQVSDVAEYVLSLSGQSEDSAAASRGVPIFEENCAACHGEDGAGIQELGGPNLTNGIWLYGGEKADIVAMIANSRAGMMPYWKGRLDPVTIKQLAVFVHSLGGGQ